MPRPGRNDPCPCGSGRKYKRCCLGREAEHDANAAALERVVLPQLASLARFAETATRQPLEAVARTAFPFWRGRLDEAMTTRVVDYLMFDVRHERFGRTAIDQYVLERGHALGEQARAVVTSWQTATRRLYRVDGWSAGFLLCTDALAEDLRPISVWPVGRSAGVVSDGAPVALRALSIEAAEEFKAGQYVCVGRPTQFGARSVDDVIAGIKRRHLDFVRTQRIVSIDDFLRLAPTALDEEAAAAAVPASGIIVPGA